jgi:hypothetical protein
MNSNYQWQLSRFPNVSTGTEEIHKLGAISFLPKEKMTALKNFLEDVVLNGGKSIWLKFFDRLGEYFNKRFDPDWKAKDNFFKDPQHSQTCQPPK